MPEDHPITVLLIDDQAIVGEAVRRMLAGEADIHLEFCQDPTKAIQTANTVHPTVILQDLVMPEIDGLTLVKFFRANPDTRNVPLIVLSTKEEPTIKAEAFSLGANDYLVKLPDRVELIARIRYHSAAYINLLERNEAYEALVESQAALTNELNQAAAYVRSLLPPKLNGDITTDWEFIPSTALGGDSFGYHWIDDDHFGIYLLDVCGHGVGAALLSISVINTLRSESLHHGNFLNPGDVLARLNDVYLMESHNNMFFTLWYGVYNTQTRVLDFASGGHPPAIAIMGGSSQREIHKLVSNGVAIGAMPGQTYKNARFKVPTGTHLYIYSDGAYEITAPDGKMWRLDDFMDLLSRLSKREACDVNAIVNVLKDHQQTTVFEDDVSLMEIRF
ncbi:MAG: SpoIIE family protein phosphatase [Deltaproteobacteria bacterium]|nr:SpoIIE family protein phosphatase [Deltaproteobacteria bacterium]